jgi:hypothetical protein
MKAKPVGEVEEAPRVSTWVPKYSMQDPGTYISPERVSIVIERVFNNGPRLGAAPVPAATEAA